MMFIIIFILPIIITSLFAFTWVKFQKYQFLERNYNIVAKHPEYSIKWHFWKGLNQGTFFLLMFFFLGWKITLLNMFIYWTLFDGMFNIQVLKREFFYIGKTAWIDKNIQKFANLISIPSTNKIPAKQIATLLKIGGILIMLKVIF